jgi:hypothetical protein
MLGTVCCASAGDAANSNNPISTGFMKFLLGTRV